MSYTATPTSLSRPLGEQKSFSPILNPGGLCRDFEWQLIVGGWEPLNPSAHYHGAHRRDEATAGVFTGFGPSEEASSPGGAQRRL